MFSNQVAFFGDRQKEGPIWLEGLAARLGSAGRRPDGDRLYSVSVEDLVGAGGFCHLNTMIVRRALYDAVGGMDEGIRWECDHDLFLRLIDKAAVMLLSPAVVSRHNIPDPAKAASMTTSLSEVQRRLFQLRVFEKASLFAVHPAIRAHGRQYQGYTLKRIAEALAAGRRQALGGLLRAPGACRSADDEMGWVYGGPRVPLQWQVNSVSHGRSIVVSSNGMLRQIDFYQTEWQARGDLCRCLHLSESFIGLATQSSTL